MHTIPRVHIFSFHHNMKVQIKSCVPWVAPATSILHDLEYYLHIWFSDWFSVCTTALQIRNEEEGLKLPQQIGCVQQAPDLKTCSVSAFSQRHTHTQNSFTIQTKVTRIITFRRSQIKKWALEHQDKTPYPNACDCQAPIRVPYFLSRILNFFANSHN